MVSTNDVKGLRRFFGDKKFYKVFLSLALPILLQTLITNFVNLLDNLMVGRIGTEQMSGVSIANSLLFVFNLAIFGAISGVGIFTAQYFGDKKYEEMKGTIRFGFIAVASLLAISILIFIFAGEALIKLFLHESEAGGDLTSTLSFGKEYLLLMLIGLPAFVVSQVYSGTLRCANLTITPMISGISAVAVNLTLNYILIYGKMGAPALGVQGAAIATVVSRYVELSILIFWTHKNPLKAPFFKGVYKTLRVPKALALRYLIKGLPICANEFLWSLSMTMLIQSFSLRGLSVVAALNISHTLSDLFYAGFVAFGNAVGILIGNLLGAGKLNEAKISCVRAITFSVLFYAVFAVILAVIAPYFPRLYNTTEEVRLLAKQFVWVVALFLPLNAFLNSTYFTIRAGGKTYITFLFDCGYSWLIPVPLAFILARFTNIPIALLYLTVTGIDFFKAIIGFIMLKKGIWCNNIIGSNK